MLLVYPFYIEVTVWKRMSLQHYYNIWVNQRLRWAKAISIKAVGASGGIPVKTTPEEIPMLTRRRQQRNISP